MKFPNDSFFNKLQASIEDIIDDEQLSIGRVDHPFTVPKGYFEQASQQILALTSAKKPKGKQLAFPKFKVWYAAAAILLLSSVTAWFYTNSVADNSVLVQNLTNEEILSYLENEPIGYSEIANSVDFTNEEIYELTSESLPFDDDLDYMLDSPELLMEEIQQLNEK
ncbi:MAG: hypothetical protein NWQ46_10175 [Spirosomaceae bacterium]|nr:hypothetical protein [Spirosomataceae bacterium]